jgi:protein-tyrosine phosphatase
MSPHTRERLSLMAIEAFDRERMPLMCSGNDLATADLVVALKEGEHREMLAAGFPGWEDRVTYWHVHDVDQAAPEKALAEIEALVHGLIQQLATAEKVAEKL